MIDLQVSPIGHNSRNSSGIQIITQNTRDNISCPNNKRKRGLLVGRMFERELLTFPKDASVAWPGFDTLMVVVGLNPDLWWDLWKQGKPRVLICYSRWSWLSGKTVTFIRYEGHSLLQLCRVRSAVVCDTRLHQWQDWIGTKTSGGGGFWATSLCGKFQVQKKMRREVKDVR